MGEWVDLSAADLPEGTILRRMYKGNLHKVYIVRGPSLMHRRRTIREASSRNRWWRYRYDEEMYKSLSAIAAEITGDKTMSGNRFFGLRRLRRGS